MRVICLLLLLTIAKLGHATTDSLINVLNNELEKTQLYDSKKEREIRALKQALKKVPTWDLSRRYELVTVLYDQYKSFQFDSAYIYVNKMLTLSRLMKDRAKEYDSKVKLGFILLSSGMFTETFDSVREMNVNYLSDSTKIDYYTMLTRAYYDLASYVNDKYYAPSYNKLAGKYMDSAITISSEGSFEKKYWNAYKKFKNGEPSQAIIDLKVLLNQNDLTKHQFAIAASTISNIYTSLNQTEQGIDLLIQAAIADLQSSTKETIALFWLSEILYKQGDIPNAYNYIRHAMADAEFYGARQRIFQISTILPIVAAEKLNHSEKEKTTFQIFLVSVTILTLLIIFFSVMLYKQLHALKAKEKIIEETNEELARTNEKLVEGTKIKEEYIGYFFDVISGYILKLEKLKRSIDMKLTVKKIDDIGIIINNINIKEEREKLFHTFDSIFLKIFPNFITEFNSLLKPEDQIWPKEHEVLTTDLRIFALIRMGIEDNATIANILEYTEKTIYVYKMRIKAKALIHGDEFEKRIMAIRAETEK